MKTNKLIMMVLPVFLFFSACSQNKKQQDLYKTKRLENSKVIVEKLQKDISVKPSHKALIVNNQYGDIFVRKTKEPYVGILSTTQIYGKNAAKARIDITNRKNEIKVNIAYDTKIIKTFKGHEKDIGRVDLVVFVPDLLELDLKTSYGVINIKEIKNDVVLKSQSGKIQLSSSGAVKINTVSGNIYVNLMRPNWDNKSVIKTEKGNIILTFPQISKLDLQALSGENIHTNFKAELSKKRGMYQFFNYAPKNTINLYSTKGFIKLVSVDQNNVEIKP